MTTPHFQEPLLERLQHWAGWEVIYTHKNRVLASLSILLACLFAIGFIISSYTRSSQIHISEAERIIAQLKSGPESTATSTTLFSSLNKILPKTRHVTHQFAGFLTQESLLQHQTSSAWHAVHSQLAAPSLLLYQEIVHLSELIEMQQYDQALQKISSLTEKPLPSPMYAYVLLEKIALLRQLSQSTEHTIEELQAVLEKDPVLDHLFSTIDNEGASSMLEFFQAN